MEDRFLHAYHLYADGEWGRPLAEHLNALDRIDVPYRVICGVVGSPENRAEAIRHLPENWEVVEFDDGFEDRTLNLIPPRLTDIPVLYAHTKGAGFPRDESDSWRACLTQQVVGKWRTNLEALEHDYDIVGAHWLTPDKWFDVESPFFGGNYWWSTAAHLRDLPPLRMVNRFSAERWIGTAPARVLNLVSGWPGPECAQHQLTTGSALRVAAVEDGTACGYYRIRLPFDELQKHGHDVQHARAAEAFDDSWPILVAQRFGFPGFEMEWLKLFRKHSMIWETDDDLWSVDPVNKRAHRIFTPEFLKGLEFCVRTARLVTVTNDHLAERMSRFNPNIRIIPNMIDAALPKMNRVRRDQVTIGWAGGDSHRRDMAKIIAPLHRIVRTTDANVHTIGQDFSNVLRLPEDRHYHSGWEQKLIKYYSTIDFDIGLAPLEDTMFTRSKSYIKALEYGALGIPVIASNVGPYRDYVDDGVTGFLVSKESEWIDRMRLLIEDPELRESMGAAAREKAIRHTIAAGWQQWEDAYRSVA